jgi:hypothetical protein
VGSSPIQVMGVSVNVYPVFVLSCVGSGLATSWSPVQGVPLSVKKNDYRTEEEAGALNGLEERLKKERHVDAWI